MAPAALYQRAVEQPARSPSNRRTQMSENRGYHGHVYYNAETKPAAAKLRETLMEKFKVEGGALSDEPRGPHPIWQLAVIFETPVIQQIVPWLMLNCDGLEVLVHPLTESS